MLSRNLLVDLLCRYAFLGRETFSPELTGKRPAWQPIFVLVTFQTLVRNFGECYLYQWYFI